MSSLHQTEAIVKASRCSAKRGEQFVNSAGVGSFGSGVPVVQRSVVKRFVNSVSVACETYYVLCLLQHGHMSATRHGSVRDLNGPFSCPLRMIVYYTLVTSVIIHL